MTGEERRGSRRGLVDDPHRVGRHDFGSCHAIHELAAVDREDDLVTGYEFLKVAERSWGAGAVTAQHDVAGFTRSGRTGPPADAAIERGVGDPFVDG